MGRWLWGGGQDVYKLYSVQTPGRYATPPADTSKEEEAILSTLYDQLSCWGGGGGVERKPQATTMHRLLLHHAYIRNKSCYTLYM